MRLHLQAFLLLAHIQIALTAIELIVSWRRSSAALCAIELGKVLAQHADGFARLGGKGARLAVTFQMSAHV